LTFNKSLIFQLLEFLVPLIMIFFGTTYYLGFDTALNTAVECIDKLGITASSHNRLFFVEVMGRDVGHIALNAGVGAGAEEILIPEEKPWS